jgi:redox-sensing transcriptional repressor
VLGAFDTDPAKIGTKVHGVPIHSMDEIEQRIAALSAQIAILTVPSPFAQATAQTLVRAGIKSIWNFTNAKLKVPDDIVVQREDLSSGYAILTVKIQARARAES